MSTPDNESLAEEVNEPLLSFAEFLETTPPSQPIVVTGLAAKHSYAANTGQSYLILKPDIQLHCPSDTCNGVRFHRCKDITNSVIYQNIPSFVYMIYICTNCQKNAKTFSLQVEIPQSISNASEIFYVKGIAYKLGDKSQLLTKNWHPVPLNAFRPMMELS